LTGFQKSGVDFAKTAMHISIFFDWLMDRACIEQQNARIFAVLLNGEQI